jgi:hypothetical protein
VSLLADILAHPDEPSYGLERDNALRLAYAGAIEPEDPARAELIRLQIEPAGSSGPARRRSRARDLLARHGRGWAAVTDLVDAYRFYRGFTGHVTLSARDFLDRGERLYALAPITEVALRGGVREHLDAVAASPLLARLRAIDLAGQGIGDAGAARLASSPHLGNLIALNLEQNRLTANGVRALAAGALPRLRIAGLSGNLDDLRPATADGAVELPPLAQQLEDEHGGRIPWLHAGAEWWQDENEALTYS